MKDNIQKADELFLRATSGLLSKQKSTELLQEYLLLVRKTAYSGNSEAQFRLGTIYEDEELMKQLIIRLSEVACQKKSLYWYKKACLQDHPYACHNLGGIYGIGKIVNNDIEKEMYLYLKAYKLGLDEAGYALAMTYKEHLNYKEAIVWLKNVLSKEPNDGEVIFELGKFYYEGLGVKKNFQKAYKLFSKAEKSNYITQYTKEEVLFYIGKMYFYGQYVEKSIGKAKYLFEKANIDNDHEDITEFCKSNAELLKIAKKEKVVIS